MKFKYSGIDIKSYGDIEEDLRQQISKTNKAAQSLNDTVPDTDKAQNNEFIKQLDR